MRIIKRNSWPSYLALIRRVGVPLTLALFLAVWSANVAFAQGRRMWMYNMQQIHMGLENYQQIFKRLPTDVLDSTGVPILSWRVLLLPFVEYGHLYDQFKLNEPWDSPHNLKLAEKIPHCYESSYYGSLRHQTHVGMVRGKDTYLGLAPRPFLNPSDPFLAKAILLVDLDDDQAVIWTKPDLWSFDAKKPFQGLVEKVGDRFFPEPGFLLMTADGQPRFLPKSTPVETVRAWFSPKDHPEPPSISWLEIMFRGPHSADIWPPLAMHLLMFSWSLWIVKRYWRRQDVSPGEDLVVVLGSQQGVLLLFFTIFSLSLTTPVPKLTDFLGFRSHFQLWFFPRIAGLAASITVCLTRKIHLQKIPFVLLAICLGAGIIDGSAGEWPAREALVTVPPPYLTAVASFLLVGLTVIGGAGPIPQKRPIAHWTGLALSLVPLALFWYWEHLGYAYPRVWFQYIRE